MDIAKIRKAMEKELDAKRYEHTLGVAYTAASLAMCYDVDVDCAIVAGLLHDCAKCISHEKKITICEKRKMNITDTERKNPSLLHAKVGSVLAIEEYDVANPDIINAIMNHTTGRPGMSMLEKIIFIADYIEPGRNKAKNLKKIRKMAFEDLDLALMQILLDTLEYLEESKEDIDNKTRETYEFYVKNLKKR